MQHEKSNSIEKNYSTMKKNWGDCLMHEYNGYKVASQYIEVINLQK